MRGRRHGGAGVAPSILAILLALTATFTLRGVVEPDGRPAFVLERPANRD